MRQQFKVLANKVKRPGRLQEVALFDEDGTPLDLASEIVEIGGAEIPWEVGVVDGDEQGQSFIVKRNGIVFLVGSALFTPTAIAKQLCLLPERFRTLTPDFANQAGFDMPGLCYTNPLSPCRITVGYNGFLIVGGLPAETLNQETYITFTGANYPARIG